MKEACIGRGEEKEEPKKQHNNKQPFEHAQKKQALNTNWKKKDMNTKGNRHVWWKTTEFTIKKAGIVKEDKDGR